VQQTQLRRTDGFVWWRLRDTLPRHVLPLVCGAVGGIGGLVGGFVASPGNPWVAAGGAIWAAALAAWSANRAGRGSVPFVVDRRPGGMARTLRSMGIEFTQLIRTSVALGLAGATISTIWLGWAGFLELFAATVALGVVIAIPYSVREGLEKQLAPVGAVRVVSPRASLRASGYADMLSAVLVSFFALCVSLALVMIVSPLAPAGSEQFGIEHGLRFGTGFTIALTSVIVGQSDAFAFAVAKMQFALLGILPYRLMRFLDDAHSRGVLRQVGTSYEFRHARLRAVLAEPSGDHS
jgi:hypothetical protein